MQVPSVLQSTVQPPPAQVKVQFALSSQVKSQPPPSQLAVQVELSTQAT